MSRFGLEQAAVEVGQAFVLKLVSQEAKSLARTSFDEPRNEQAIYGPLRLIATNEHVQPPAIIAGAQPPKMNFPLTEQTADHFKVLEFLMNNADHFAAQFVVFDVR